MEQYEQDCYYMSLALEEAQKAFEKEEVPIGAVIVQDNKVISAAHNLRETKKNAIFHAEMLAIDQACKTLGGWRLPRCTLYVTLEPCPMCAGAIINARIDRVVFGAYDYKAGSCGSVVNLFELNYNHKPLLNGGVMQEVCAQKLKDFFAYLRQREKERKRNLQNCME